jgi:hypothetical protein
VYFSRNNDVSENRKQKQIVCPALNDKGTVMVARHALVRGDFESLSDDEQQWYLNQLSNDIVLRFKINFPVLFANFGVDMLQTRTTLVSDPTKALSLVGVFAARLVNVKLARKVSPALSATNNMAIMLAAVLHENLSEGNAEGWHNKFLEQIKSISQWCSLTPATIDRSCTAAKLMLRSNVIACLLPSFVTLLTGQLVCCLMMLRTLSDSRVSLLRK